MEKSQYNLALIHSIKKGYRVDENGTVINPNGKPLKGFKNRDNYIVICIRYNSKSISIMVHRIQAFQKYGYDMFKEGIEVRHKNGISTDNSWDNILIGTHSENMMDIPIQVRMSKAFYATSFVRKHNKKKIREFYSKHKSYAKTMKEFNISSKGTLHYILNKD